MVRFKKRYFVVQLDRQSDIYVDDSDGECDKKKKSSKKNITKKKLRPRAWQDSRPLDIPDGVLAESVKSIVEQIHGEFGRASITTGLRTIYCNPETHLVLIQCRHGPHRLVASSLPFMTKIKNEKVIPRLLYTGATIRHCFKRMEMYQRQQIEIACKELDGVDEEDKKDMEARLMAIRTPSYDYKKETLTGIPDKNVNKTSEDAATEPTAMAIPSKFVRIFLNRKSYSTTSSRANVMNVFDRKAKCLQRERAANREDVENFDFLKEEMGYRLADRVLDVKREMDVCVDICSGRGFVTRHLTKNFVKKVYALEMSETMLSQCQLPPDEEEIACEKVHVDEDNKALPFDAESVNLVTSSGGLHWVNNLPGVFVEANRILKPDGVFIGSMFGGETLFELRCALQMAELEREGGFGPHVSPFVKVRDLGGLLNESGFTMLTIDSDELTVKYPTVIQLMRDLKGMAENNASWSRKLRLKKDTLVAANAIYRELYGNEDGSLPATFQIYYWIGWKPDPSQPKSLKPQTSDVSLKDLHRLEDVVKEKGE